MKNKEFYKDKIFDAACKYKNLAVDKETGEICKCPLTLCKYCALLEIKDGSGKFGSCIDAWVRWLEQEHVEPILDSVEKRYLENVVRPFRRRVKSITKSVISGDNAYLRIECTSILDDFSLPTFGKDEAYLCMEPGREYTIEELGLFENE